MEEENIRSTIKKLWRHLLYILNIEKETRPISLVVHLTNKCNLDCEFCYIRNRDRTHELDYDKLINFILDVRPKSIELTGGEPCVYPKINDLIVNLNWLGIKIGMFTNGIHLGNVKKSLLKCFSWIRVSINNYIDNDIEFNDPPYTGKLGYIYIKHKNSPTDLRERIIKFIENHRGSYLKIAPDINNPPNPMIMTTDSPQADFLTFWGVDRVIVQETQPTKDYKGKCYMGFLKPYLNADGLVYPCINTVDPKTRIRDKSKSITNIDRPQDLLNFGVPYKEMNCKNCGLWDRNEFIKYIKKGRVEDEDFL